VLAASFLLAVVAAALLVAVPLVPPLLLQALLLPAVGSSVKPQAACRGLPCHLHHYCQGTY
jgi:hypothetical protein